MTTERRVYTDDEDNDLFEEDAPRSSTNGAGAGRPPPPPPPPPQEDRPWPWELRELIEAGKVVDKYVEHGRGFLRSPQERAGLLEVLRAFQDFLSGRRSPAARPHQSYEPPPAAQEAEGEAEGTKAIPTALVVDMEALMVKVEEALELVVLVHGDRPIGEIPALLGEHREAIKEELQRVMAECCVYRPIQAEEGDDDGHTG